MNRDRGKWVWRVLGAVVLANPGVAGEAWAEVVIDTVTVGNPGNAGENSGASEWFGSGPDRICGAVDYAYRIGKYEITTGQYVEFLNAVAAEDTYELYSSYMWSTSLGCKIERDGSSGSYSYSVAPDWADRPVNWVSWDDAARFANWLHNRQPAGSQGLATTEDGSYFLNGATTSVNLLAVVREVDATWVIPSEDEWYKAAYYKGGGTSAGYWDFPTETDFPSPPTAEAPPGTDTTYGSANYGRYSDAIGRPYFRTEVGAYNAKPSDSPYGTFDQGGNVSEWNEAVFSVYRGVRGGSFSADWGLYAASRTGTFPMSANDSRGFRVAKITVVDLNGNGTVDLYDLALFQADFGDTLDLGDFAAFQAAMAGPH